MRRLLFLARLAFLCNVFFLLAVSLQFSRWFRHEDVEATIIIIGYVMVALLNPVANLCCLFLFFNNRTKLLVMPQWLWVTNFIFLLLQIVYLIVLNGTKHS